MKWHRILSAIPIWGYVFVGSCLAAGVIAITHPAGAIISFDEGFHGGAALYFDQIARQALGWITPIISPDYIQREFSNGVTLYPPLWTIIATGLSLMFEPSTFVFRTATVFFYVGTIMLVYWFVVKATKQQLPAILCATIVGTIPMVIIYSHLMMLELPLLMGVSAMIMSFFLLTRGIIGRRWYTLLWVSLIFILAPLSKLPAFPVAWAIIVTYAVASSILFWRQKLYRDFLKPEIIILSLLSLGSVWLTIRWVEHQFGVNMLDFFVGQTQGEKTRSPIIEALNLAWTNKYFYLRDFKHIPILTTIWFGSTLGYFIWRRTPLSLLLLIWTLVTYVAFSGVQPQVPQYLMVIYAPLGIASGLMIYELAHYFRTRTSSDILAIGVALLLVCGQLFSLPKSEGYGWRTNKSGQEDAALVIAQRAKFGDRVISWHDGDIYALRIATLDKYLQISNGTTQTCQQAMRDSFEWALVVDEPPHISAVDAKNLGLAPWQEVKRYGSKNTTILYHSPTTTWPTVIEAEEYGSASIVADEQASGGKALLLDDTKPQPQIWGCVRILPLGKSRADFYFKLNALSSAIRDDESVIRIEHSAANNREFVGKTITAGELRSGSGYKSFQLDLEHTEMNLSGEFIVRVYRPSNITFDKIVITPLASK